MRNFSTAICVLLFSVSFLFSQDIWINEFHYDNTSTDEGEFVEIVAPSDFAELADVTLSLYNGNGGGVYDSYTMDNFLVGATDNSFTIYYVMTPDIQNGAPDGLAIDYGGSLIQFISYEGTITATDGPANGIESVDVGVAEAGSEAAGLSLQLTGTGLAYSDFTWTGPADDSPGAINTGQVFVAGINNPTDFAIEYTTSDKMSLTWTAPSGLYDQVLIFGRGGAAVDHIPSGDGSNYNDASPDWNSAGTYDNSVLLYSGTGTSVTITELINGADYYFKAFTYQGSEWSTGTSDIHDIAEIQNIYDFAATSGNGQADLTWTNNSAPVDEWWNSVIILGKEGSAVDATPSGNPADYTANANFGAGSQLGTGNFVVYQGTGASETITNLTNGNLYCFTAFVCYNNSAGGYDYSTGVSSSASPLAAVPALMISEVADPADNYNARFVGLYNASGAAIDFARQLWYLSRQSNGGSTWGDIPLSGSISPGALYIIANSQSEFNSAYGFDPDTASGSINGNGNDGYFLFWGGDHESGTLVDAYGVIDVDGTGELWDYEDGHAERNAGTAGPNAIWTASEWTITSPANVSDIRPGDTSLPVQLNSFSAYAADGLVTLRWITESEMDNVGFEVFRSMEKEGEYTLMSSYLSNAALKGQVNSNTRHEYRFTDRLVVNGESYWYKLADVDLNGARSFHGPVFAMPHQGSGAVLSDGNIPEKFALRGNYPNPFNPRTTIIFDIPQLREGVTEASLLVYNALGQQVRVLYQGNIAAGQYRLEWDGSGENGNSLPSGIYYAVLQTEQFVKTIKMMLLK